SKGPSPVGTGVEARIRSNDWLLQVSVPAGAMIVTDGVTQPASLIVTTPLITSASKELPPLAILVSSAGGSALNVISVVVPSPPITSNVMVRILKSVFG